MFEKQETSEKLLLGSRSVVHDDLNRAVLTLVQRLSHPTNFVSMFSVILDLTRCRVFGDVKRVRDTGELGRVVIDVLDGDVQPHVRRLFPVVCAHQKGVLGAPLPIQLLGGDQVSGFGINPKAVVGAADDGVRHKSVRALRQRQKTESTSAFNFNIFWLIFTFSQH